MDTTQYNLNQYNRKKQWYRFTLGMGQMKNYPIINFIWLLFGVGIVCLVKGMQIILNAVDVPQIVAPIFRMCIIFIVIFFPILVAVGMVQGIGELSAREDEANVFKALGDKGDARLDAPILIRKKLLRKKGVIIREFYTTIPMKDWICKQDDFCDIMNIHLVENIEYGGKNGNNGNRIVIKSAKGRKPTDRGVLYDDAF